MHSTTLADRSKSSREGPIRWPATRAAAWPMGGTRVVSLVRHWLADCYEGGYGESCAGTSIRPDRLSVTC